MPIGAKETTGWKATIAVAMSNYIEAGSIIAIAVSLTNWQVSPTEQNGLQVLVWSCTVLATWWGFMRYADHVDRRRLYAAGAALGIVAWVVLVYAEGSLPVLLTYAVFWGVSAGIGAQAFYSVWTSELFATRYRASAQGVLFFAARCAVGGLSYWFPTLLTEQGVPFVGTLMIGLLLVALVVGTVWAPDTQGKTLQEIEAERYGEVLDPDPEQPTDAGLSAQSPQRSSRTTAGK